MLKINSNITDDELKRIIIDKFDDNFERDIVTGFCLRCNDNIKEMEELEESIELKDQEISGLEERIDVFENGKKDDDNEDYT